MMNRLFHLIALIGASACAWAQTADSTAVVVEEEVLVADTVPAEDAPATVKFHPYEYFALAQAGVASGEHNPFWLVANRFGLASIDKTNGYIRAGLIRHLDPNPRFSWGFGVDLAGAFNYTSKFVVQQLYGEVRYRSLNLTVGSKQWTNGVVDPALSSGDMLFSANARPIPQVRLEMPDWQWIPYTKQWAAVRGYFSFGHFTDSRWERNRCRPVDQTYAEHRLFHSKGLFVRGGNPDRFPLIFEGGLEMGCEFGGTAYAWNSVTNKYEIVKFPKGIKEWIKAVIPMGGGDSNDPNQAGEISNVYGNHAGQWSAALSWQPKDAGWSARLYYEHFFEDHSMMLFDHAWKDMLLGVQVNLPANPFVTSVVYEYINTRDQSGAVYWDWTPEVPDQISGADDYYNNPNFGNWQQWGMGMGNPLLLSPIYNTNGSLLFMHNRIKGHHLALRGTPHRDLDYRVLLTYTRSWGTYRYPVRNMRHNFNGLVELTYRPHQLKGWAACLGVGADGGNLLGGSFGAQLTICKTGWF